MDNSKNDGEWEVVIAGKAVTPKKGIQWPKPIKRCKYGHNVHGGCELGHPGCLCADEDLIREMGEEPNRDLLTKFDEPQPWDEHEE